MSLALNLRRRVGGPVRRLLLPLWPREGEAWDRAAGVETEEWAAIPDLTVNDTARADGHPYGPTTPRVVRVSLDAVAAEGRTFIDMGSGRGRVLLMASERPFRSVVGVEFAAELHESTLENLRRFPVARMQCRDVRSVHEDAAAYEFPVDPLVVFFCNPFSEKIMEVVVTNLADSYARHPRPVVVVYHQQVREGKFTTTNNLKLLDRQAFLTGRTIRSPIRDRPFLMPFIVRVYESREALQPARY